MMKKIAVIVISVLLLLLAAGFCFAEEGGGTVTGYFADRVFVRPSMTWTLDYVDSFPPYTIVTLEIVDDTWAVYTSQAGVTGYVRYGRILPVPEYDHEPERLVYSENRVEIRSLAIYDAPVIYKTQPYELLTVDGRIKGYIHVIAGDGTAGYLIESKVRRAEFTPEPISPATLCVAEETALLDMPLLGARQVGSLVRDRFYTAEGAIGDYYYLKMEDGSAGYVEKKSVAICSAKNAKSRTFFSLPKGRGAGRADQVESVFAHAIVRPEGARMRKPDGGGLDLPGDARVYLYTGYGAWYGAVWENQAGYLPREEVEILTVEVMMARLKQLDLSGGSIERNDYLDQAFTMVEEGNPFQARYNLLTGAETKSLLPLGIPYFWGGRNYQAIVERLPNYTTREAWQSSLVYYQKGTIYLYGFDCIGFVKAVYHLAGTPIEGSVTGHRAAEFCETGQHIYCDDVYPLPGDWAEAARTMRVGDIMVIHHPGTHAMMYMGTLRDYGYTEEQLPALAKYLDYPLMFQSGENPYSYLRFQSYIAGSTDTRTAGATPPDGGVSVCILGVPREDAELIIECHDTTSYCFDVEGTCVTIMGFGNVADYFVYRMDAPETDPIGIDTIEIETVLVSLDELEAAGDDQAQSEEDKLE